jgi:thiol:disulfide interchange protein
MKRKFLPFIPLLICLLVSAFAESTRYLKVNPLKQKIEISAGESDSLTIKINIPDNLYIYGNPKGPGIGRPTTIDIDHPDNFIFHPAIFAPPEKYTPKGESDYVWIYKKETKIDIPFKVKKDAKQGDYTISVLLKALVCSDRACTPEDYSFKYPVRVISGSGKTIPDKNNNMLSTSDSQKNGDNVQINENTKNSKIYSKEISSIKPRFISTVYISNIIEAIIFGLIAGFILNFTPCVLPVISLKILDFVKYSGDSKKNIGKMGLAFAMGIISSFAVLAFLASYLEYSWGSLFQNSIFLIIMLTIVFVLSLSMFEVFTLNIPGFAQRASQESSDNKYAYAYSKGLLATLLATPCSGPFLGGTLAWSSTQPYYVIFIVFMSIGIGMSLPYIILTSIPGLIKFIPKPGEWMKTFETVIGLFLLGTCVYLIGILEQKLIMPTLWFLIFTSIAFWQYGKYGSIIKPKKNRIISRIAAILIIIAGYFLSYNYFYAGKESPGFLDSDKKNFSMDILFKNKANGKISIIDFTADWCPNCKLVEKTSLYTDKVARSLKRRNIELLTADLTRENPDASVLLTKLGSRSIPFLALFPAGNNFYEPICLRDIYSEKDVLKAIKMAK